MVATLTKRFRFEQRSVIKLLLAEKYRPWETYKIMCDVYAKARFSKKDIYK